VSELPELPILIFAGTYSEAHRYAHEKNLERWRFVSSPKDLQGICQPIESWKCPEVGTYWKREDARALKALAYASGILLVPDA
jgi:hypothetical protein